MYRYRSLPAYERRLFWLWLWPLTVGMLTTVWLITGLAS